MPTDTTPGKSTYVALALATTGALTLLGRLTCTLVGPAPPLDIEFVGVTDNDVRCHGPVVSDGRVAWAACELPAREEALVELDPETARATMVQRWPSKSGNPPILQIHRACGDGDLFVVGTTGETTLVTRRAGEVRSLTANVRGLDVLGAACVEAGIELFVADHVGYAVLRVTDAGSETLQSLQGRDSPGRVAAAWFEAGAWQVVVHEDEKFLSGPLGSKLTPTGATSPSFSVCPIGPPGGWLGTTRSGACWGSDAILTRDDQGFHARETSQSIEGLVVDAPSGRTFGTTLLADDAWQFRGRGAQDFDLRRRGQFFEAVRGDAAPVVVVNAPSSAFDVKLRAVPLSGERVAVWGNLGSIVMLLGPDLRRLDPPGPLYRIQNLTAFVHKNTRESERTSFFIALIVALAWLPVLATFRRSTPHTGRYRLVAILIILVLLICAQSFFKIVPWL